MNIAEKVPPALGADPHWTLAAFENDKLMADCPLVGYPTGWFVAAWSHEVPVGKVIPARYFGEDLVIWRGESGQAVVMDAYCPHMGCHLAIGAVGHALEHGGTVGDTIQCPFHGWRFDAQGLQRRNPLQQTSQQGEGTGVAHAGDLRKVDSGVVRRARP